MATILEQAAAFVVEGMPVPARAAEEVLEVLTAQCGDGREVSLADLPLAHQLSSAERVRAEEIVLSVPDGRRIRTLVNATPIRSGEGDVESVVVTLQDLAPLDELERMRVEFVGMVSHELRAPLTAIKGSAATALGASRKLDRAEVRQLFRIIEDQADHVGSLISDLLDAGRIETGTLSVDPEPEQVVGLVEKARSAFLSDGGRHAVHVDLPLEWPRVLADGQRIVQVLNNLFTNAARHSPEATSIRVDAMRDGVHVAISVSDEGRGVSPEQLPHLFRKHAGIGSGDPAHGTKGYGLGLAICKGLVEAHGGRIWAESDGVGRGTRFTFTIPTAGEAEGGAAPGFASDGDPSSRRSERETRILVVDDDPQTLRYVRDALAEGVRLFFVESYLAHSYGFTSTDTPSSVL